MPSPLHARKLLCVYCSSSASLDQKYYLSAEALGRGLVARGWGLVYGGGRRGLMGSVAHAVQQAGGHVVGIIPEFMKSRELAFNEANELVTVSTMRERKQQMEERADAFVTLPGGIGTLEELTEIMTLRYLNQLSKPVVLVNQDGFYDDLLRFFDRMVAERFKSPGMNDLFAVANDVDDVWRHLESPRPFMADELWR
ncbi:MAG TPA: TIGR00730 family Rossman fold protein [Opitutaceae bacterium]|nr:TIGR00730 family Rossman fold protein [Opitutaceae bacterium]